MRASLKLFTWFGIPVYLHWTFGLLVLFGGYLFWSDQNNGEVLLWIAGLMVALFTCVLLHEYGHSLMARRYGVNTRDILLTPIGGIARLERMPEKPVQELLVAVAGPLVNVVIAVGLFVLSALIYRGEEWEIFTWLLERMFSRDQPEVLNGAMSFMAWLLVANVSLVIFNLIPAFPMDGGRIFRSLLAMRIGRVRATRMAALLGQAIALFFIGSGFFWGVYSLSLVGFFVFVTARMENSTVQLDALLRRFSASDLVRTQYNRLSVTDWMQTPADLLRHGLEGHFLVFNLADQMAGTLEKGQIVSATKKRDLGAPVSNYMNPHVQTVHPQDSLHYVYYLIRYQNNPLVAVADENGLLGVIDETGLQNFIRLQR